MYHFKCADWLGPGESEAALWVDPETRAAEAGACRGISRHQVPWVEPIQFFPQKNFRHSNRARYNRNFQVALNNSFKYLHGGLSLSPWEVDSLPNYLCTIGVWSLKSKKSKIKRIDFNIVINSIVSFSKYKIGPLINKYWIRIQTLNWISKLWSQFLYTFSERYFAMRMEPQKKTHWSFVSVNCWFFIIWFKYLLQRSERGS